MDLKSLPDCDLAGMGVLVTRAEHQAGPLCELIAARDGRPIPFPAIEIREPLDPAPVRALLARLNDFQMALFVSPNAVRYGVAMRAEEGFPSHLKIGAVGRGTARVLEQAGLKVEIVPAGECDSESLLAMPELGEVAGQRILIFRGDGGRPLLGDTLRQRGAEVVYAEVYRRACPDADAAALLKRWPTRVQVVTASSIDILNNLVAMLGAEGRELLSRTPLVVISRRMHERAEALGCRQIILARGADDRSMLEALCNYARG